MTTTSRRVVQDQYRTGTESAAKLVAIDEVAVPDPGPGESLIRTTHAQVTAVMADLMREDSDLPMPGYTIGQPLWGGAVGVVTASGDGGLPVGTAVSHMKGLQEYVLAGQWEAFPVDPSLPEPFYALNQGVTSYHGIVDVAQVHDGDTVLVSGAAGGVGSLAGQIAKARGASTVIGTAGSAAKVGYLVEELGFDTAINYRDGNLVDNLLSAAPDGIDVFFDTVGGAQFEAAVRAGAHGARFALCGALSGQLDDSDGAHPRLDIMTAIGKELVLLPFTTMHTQEQLQAWFSHYGPWLAEGKLVYPHTLVAGGLDVAAATLDDLLSGVHRGSVIVEVES